MIPFYRPAVGDAESDAVSTAISESTLSTGEIVSEFETAFASSVGRQHAAGVSSGSAALEIALEVSRLEPGDRVLVSPFNCSAVLYSLRRANLVPVFADISADTYNLDPERARQTVEKRDGAVEGLLVTHLYGQPCQMDRLCALAEEYDMLLVEDFCQATGAVYEGQSVGTFGQLSICSFGATKPIAAAQGGAVLSDDEAIDEQVRQQRDNNGVDVTPPPQNARLSDIHAAIGLSQLQRYPEIRETKRELAAMYRDRLPDSVTPQRLLPEGKHVYHRFPIQTNDRERLEDELERHGVETARTIERPLFKYDCAPEADEENYPATTTASERSLHLPMHAMLSKDDVERVIEAVSAVEK